MQKVTRYVCDYCKKELPTERGMAGHEERRGFFSPGSHSCATCHYHIGVINGSGLDDFNEYYKQYTTACEIFKKRQARSDDEGGWYSASEVKNCRYYSEIDYQSPDSKMVGHKRNYWLREVEKLPTSKEREK